MMVEIPCHLGNLLIQWSCLPRALMTISIDQSMNSNNYQTHSFLGKTIQAFQKGVLNIFEIWFLFTANGAGKKMSIIVSFYWQFKLAVTIFFFLLQLYLITFSLQIITFTLTNIIVIAMGILFIIIGNMLPKVKQNFFMGIKTPWTLADEHVWYATHRFSGKLWFVLGLVMCACGFFPNTALVPIILISAIAAAVVPLIYSYIIYKRRTSKWLEK